MELGLSEPQQLLQRSIRDFLAQQIPLERVRAFMESSNGEEPRSSGAPAEPWPLKSLGEQGVTGLLVAEEYGGAGLGLLETVVAAQEIGRAVAPISFHTACVLAPLLISARGSEEQRQHWLPRMAVGDALVTAALDLPGAEQGRLTGCAPFVADGHLADALVVETGGALYLVPRDAPGLDAEPLVTIDGTRRAAEVRFEEVELRPEWALSSGEGRTAIERARLATLISIAADLLGASQQALQIAVEHALERRQFDRLIGSFQAVKHLLAETAALVDPVQSLLWYAAFAWDEGHEEVAWLAPLLKAHAAEVGTQAVTNTTQVFGGMGFTHECNMHIYFKRVGYDRQAFGTPDALFRQAAELQLGPARPGERQAAT